MAVGNSGIWGLVPPTQTQVGGTPHKTALPATQLIPANLVKSEMGINPPTPPTKIHPTPTTEQGPRCPRFFIFIIIFF